MAVKIKEFFEFMRLKICIFAATLSLSGSIMFNQVPFQMLIAALASFFLCLGTYSYNNISDKKEDPVNRGHANQFACNSSGILIVISSFLAGILVSFILPAVSFAISLLVLALGILYSSARLKRFMLIKNLYTGFGIPLLFLVGASVISFESLMYYFMISFFFFICSVISDIRDYKGDLKADIRTLPVRFGYKNAKISACILLVINALLIFLALQRIFPIGIFSILMISLLLTKRVNFAHTAGGFSLVSLALWLVLV